MAVVGGEDVDTKGEKLETAGRIGDSSVKQSLVLCVRHYPVLWVNRIKCHLIRHQHAHTHMHAGMHTRTPTLINALSHIAIATIHTKCNLYIESPTHVTRADTLWATLCLYTNSYDVTGTKNRQIPISYLLFLVLIHWLAILFKKGSSPSPPSVGAGFGCGRRHHLSY